MDKHFSHLVCGIITIVSIVLLLIFAHLVDYIWAKTLCGMLIALTFCLGMIVHELIDEEEDHDC